MKIGSLDTQPVATPVASERKAAAPGAATSAQVALSSAAAGLSTKGAEGPFDGQKVQRIAQAIRDGKFEVHPEAIADKLIANAQELLGKTAG